ncbi:hypothetical protein Hanom_Chr06g00552531 [Helianthus anomalus]
MIIILFNKKGTVKGVYRLNLLETRHHRQPPIVVAVHHCRRRRPPSPAPSLSSVSSSLPSLSLEHPLSHLFASPSRTFSRHHPPQRRRLWLWWCLCSCTPTPRRVVVGHDLLTGGGGGALEIGTPEKLVGSCVC